MTRLQDTLDDIDRANAADPDNSEGTPAALLYGQRMSDEVQRLFPDADEALRIAARGQHIERWILRRKDYPEGRAGYLKWRSDLARHHAERVTEIMNRNGYDAEVRETVGKMLRKEGIKRDHMVQALEDVICFVFLKWYFDGFSTTQDPDKLLRIVKKTARKMSSSARKRVLEEFNLPIEFASAFEA